MTSISKTTLRVCLLAAALAAPGLPQRTVSSQTEQQTTIQALLERLTAAEARIKELELRQSSASSQQPGIQQTMQQSMPMPQNGAVPSATMALVAHNSQPSAAGSEPSTAGPVTSSAPAAEDDDPHAHMMEIPGGPVLKIRGFFDFNYGAGPTANPLIFPLGTTAHNSFQSGEFDLFISSKLSEHIDFVSELVVGSDPTNSWGLDIERLQLTYRPSEYFQISAGRYHTAIGYYNTAYHHGMWFQTAAGRPFMYYFEDSGGLLPVHSVGVTATGRVPGTGNLGMHWVAEIGNGRSSSTVGQPVQNFLSDKNHKSFNLALYVKPEWARGIQAGGSFYRDRLVPTGIPHVNQDVTSAYIVYINPKIEFLNEAVLLTNKLDGDARAFHTPMMYTQISQKFGRYRPFFRYQYLNSPAGDPVNPYTDRYQGPSVGVRMDFSEFVAFKVQYNRLEQRVTSSNGFNSQVAFTF